jgi:predicted SAM-dependent methyltransferase
MSKDDALIGLKLNLGCGANIKSGWVNVDINARDDRLDVKCDLSKDFPFIKNSCSIIYSEHFIEHLDWVDGLSLIKKSHECLLPGGIFRVVFPDFGKLFRAYASDDKKYLNVWSKALDDDYSYYQSVLDNPKKIRLERLANPPPEWHFSQNEGDLHKIRLRARKYKHPIDILDWAVHQYGEHKTLYDELSMQNILKDVGFSEVYVSEYNDELDSSSYFIPSCCYIEARK